jgi:hypothetical protein
MLPPVCPAALLIVVDHLRCRFGHFNLGAHLLDLRLLLFQAGSEGSNFLSAAENVMALSNIRNLDFILCLLFFSFSLYRAG